MHQTPWSPERPLPPPVSLTSQSHHEKAPEVTCTSRGNPGFPASTRERPRETFFKNACLSSDSPSGIDSEPEARGVLLMIPVFCTPGPALGHLHKRSHKRLPPVSFHDPLRDSLLTHFTGESNKTLKEKLGP